MTTFPSVAAEGSKTRVHVRRTRPTADGDFDHLHPAHVTRVRIDQQTGMPLP